MCDQKLFSRAQNKYHRFIFTLKFSMKHSQGLHSNFLCFIKFLGAVIRKLSYIHLKPSICFAVVLGLEYSDIYFKKSIILNIYI